VRLKRPKPPPATFVSPTGVQVRCKAHALKLVCLLFSAEARHFVKMVRGKRGKSHLDRGSRLLPSYKARRVNAVSVQRGTDRRPGSKRFRNYCALIKIARSGFPWEKATKRYLAFPDFLRAALTEGNDVRLSSRKAACSSTAPPRSTGNPGSV